jgi:hypothetical protein
MDSNSATPATLINTTGGTLLVLLVSIDADELVRTALLAALGATISFSVSKALSWLHRRFKNRKLSNHLKK